MMSWLSIVLEGVNAVVTQWVSASEMHRAEIEARAVSAVRQLVADLEANQKAHDARTKETQAAIDAEKKE